MVYNLKIEDAFFLIPDISGFTKFLTETEILHSSHILSELLEIVINENILDLKIAEIEGDAVFFYKKWTKPSFAEIVEQCKKMYLAFHQHLKLYERDRVCDCGACMYASELHIKFIVHHGKVIQRKIHNRMQLMGLDVTLVHRLMKNDIDENEYILITKNSFSEQEQNERPQWISLIYESAIFDEIGKVDYYFSSLTPLFKEIPLLPERQKINYVSHPITHSLTINSNIDHLFKIIRNVNMKPNYMLGLKRVNYNMNQNNRIGSVHECILPFSTLSFEMVEYKDVSQNKYYAEFSTGSFFIPPYYQKFILKKIDNNSCSITTEIHFNISYIKEIIMKPLLKIMILLSVKKLKKISESEFFAI